MTDQLQIFQPGCTLADTTLEQRLSAVIDMIAGGEVPVSEREELLMLALDPGSWGAER